MIPHIVRQEEFAYAKQQLEYSLERTAGASQPLMENLSAFWAVQPYSIQKEEDSDIYLSKTAEMLMSRKEKLNEKNLFDALVILFFISQSDRCSIGFEDEVCDYFSSGARVDMFVDFCEDLQSY